MGASVSVGWKISCLFVQFWFCFVSGMVACAHRLFGAFASFPVSLSGMILFTVVWWCWLGVYALLVSCHESCC